jgi:hypothetical protein
MIKASGACVLAVAAALAGCGGSDRLSGIDRQLAEHKRAIAAAVEDGRLPPVALEVINPDGTIDVNFVHGGTYDADIVHTRDRGNRGPKLVWDLDQDGKIEPDERTITERELYHAMTGVAFG